MELLMVLKMWFFIYMNPPMQLISRDAPAYCPPVKTDQPASYANDSDYGNAWRSRSTPSAKSPAWIAYDLSKVPEEKRQKVLLVWYNEDTSPYDHALITAAPNPGYNNPAEYTIEVNAAAGGSIPDTGWVVAVVVKKNTFHSRQHVFSMHGYNWVRLSATAVDGTKGNTDISLNMDVYDASKNTDDDWIFIGDSITQMSMHHQAFACKYGTGTFSELVHAKKPRHFPVQENGGTGYMKSTDGAKHINEWLGMFPGRYVAISYGTNDAWAGMSPDEFYGNYVAMVDAVLKAGKVPLVSKIPWSSAIPEIQKNGELLNAQIEKIWKKYPQVIKGPDFWALYKEKPELLSQDGVHPSWPEGLFVFRKAWADLALEKIYFRKDKSR